MSTQSSLVDRRTWFGPWSRVHQRCHRPQVLCAHFVFHASQNCTISQWSSTISTAGPNWKLTQNRKQIIQSTLRFSFYRCLVETSNPYFMALFQIHFSNRNVGPPSASLCSAGQLYASPPRNFLLRKSTGQRKQKEPPRTKKNLYMQKIKKHRKNKFSMPSRLRPLGKLNEKLIYIYICWKIWLP